MPDLLLFDGRFRRKKWIFFSIFLRQVLYIFRIFSCQVFFFYFVYLTDLIQLVNVPPDYMNTGTQNTIKHSIDNFLWDFSKGFGLLSLSIEGFPIHQKFRQSAGTISEFFFSKSAVVCHLVPCSWGVSCHLFPILRGTFILLVKQFQWDVIFSEQLSKPSSLLV